VHVIRAATVEEIEAHLVAMGAGNHPDNMKHILRFPRHYFVELGESEFGSLVFLQTRTVSAICPAGEDRCLRVVAGRAVSSPQRQLGGNWDLDAILVKSRSFVAASERVMHLPALVLREAESERQYGPWYLQDGSHRALGYSMLMCSGDAKYHAQLAYVATNAALGTGGV